MDERPDAPPEGKLIAEALARSGMSIRQASKRAGISYGRWRQITSGFQNVSPGSWAKVTGPARTVARMAAAVGVTADEMAAAGRDDVAEILRDGAAREPAPETTRGYTEEEQALADAYIEGLRRARVASDRDAGASV